MANRRRTPKRYVAYYRVSTARQGRSGLGLEAQRRAVEDFLNGNGWEVVAEYTEVESGRRADRPELLRALAACRAHGAELVIAKLDRLSRSVALIANLMESGVDFVACDMPEANGLTVHVMEAMAEHERKLISRRTKEALAAAKARGVRLGNPGNLTPEGRLRGSRRGNEARAAAADARARDLAPVVEEIMAGGASSLRDMARELNRRGVPTPRGGEWSASQVRNVVQRVARQGG